MNLPVLTSRSLWKTTRMTKTSPIMNRTKFTRGIQPGSQATNTTK